MNDIINNAKRIAGTEEVNLYLTDEEMLKLDEEYAINQGIQQGIQQGTHETQKTIIMNMLNKEYSLEMISEIVNLPIEIIKEIINEK